MPDLLARGGVQGCGAGPGREPVAVGEPGDVADVGQDPGRDDGSDAGQVHQRRAAGQDHRLQLYGEGLDLLLDRNQLGELLGREPAAGLPGQVAGTHAERGSPWPDRW